MSIEERARAKAAKRTAPARAVEQSGGSDDGAD